MAKKIFYGKDARERVLGGAQALYDAVKVTYGPNGGNVVIGRQHGIPNVTHDGVTVADAVEIDRDKPEHFGFNEGAQWIKEAAQNLNKIAGDGTTTVTVLTYHLMKAANGLIAAGHEPQVIRRTLTEAAREAVAKIDELSEEVEGNKKRIEEVATISAGDPEIGKLIAEVISEVGKDGAVTVEPGQTNQVEKEIVKGYSWDRGWVSPFFVNTPEDQSAEYENPVFIITMQKLHGAGDIFPMVEKCVNAKRSNIVVIADEVDGDALNMLVINKLKGAANIVAVKAPSFGDRRLAFMEDIATLVGATVIRDDEVMEDVDLSVVGQARKVVVRKESTTIVSDDKTTKSVSDRINAIQQQASKSTDDYDKRTLTARAAALAGKVAVIKVGGMSETEIDEKKFRVDDAVAATRVALEDGIVPGGGVTLLNVANALSPKTPGHQLLIDALKQPFLHIMENNGLNAQALKAKVEDSRRIGFGVNVMAPEAGLVDMKKVGVIDPTRVTKEVVQNSVSIAATAATMGALVVELPEQLDHEGANSRGY